MEGTRFWLHSHGAAKLGMYPDPKGDGYVWVPFAPPWHEVNVRFTLPQGDVVAEFEGPIEQVLPELAAFQRKRAERGGVQLRALIEGVPIKEDGPAIAQDLLRLNYLALRAQAEPLFRYAMRDKPLKLGASKFGY
jgi:hypothetical protein